MCIISVATAVWAAESRVGFLDFLSCRLSNLRSNICCAFSSRLMAKQLLRIVQQSVIFHSQLVNPTTACINIGLVIRT